MEVTTNAGASFILDCGPAPANSDTAMMARAPGSITATILLSHTHWDHIQGFPSSYRCSSPATRLRCAVRKAARSLREVLTGQMEFTCFPVEIGQLPASITFRELEEGTHEMNGVRVSAQYLHHPAMTLGYRIEADDAVARATCATMSRFSETFPHDSRARLGAEDIAHEGTAATPVSWLAPACSDSRRSVHAGGSTRPKNWGHSTYEYAVDMAAAAGVRDLALTHHDPAHDDGFIAEVENRARAYANQRGHATRVCCAYEGTRSMRRSSRTALRHLPDTPSAPQSGRDASRGARILVVDDEPDLRTLANLALSQDGHVVDRSLQRPEALALIDAAMPDLVLLDLVMPKQGGMEVLRILRSKPATAAAAA